MQASTSNGAFASSSRGVVIMKVADDSRPASTSRLESESRRSALHQAPEIPYETSLFTPAEDRLAKTFLKKSSAGLGPRWLCFGTSLSPPYVSLQ